jgi:hypothetical protein
LLGYIALMKTSVSRTTSERVARNNAVVREANEAIREKTDDWAMSGLLPVLCECADPLCHLVLRLSRKQYEDVRANPRWFITAHGHVVNDQGLAAIVAEHDLYDVVEKTGRAGQIVEQLDPRST